MCLVVFVPADVDAVGYIPDKDITASDIIATDINDMIVYPHFGTPAFVEPGQQITAELAASGSYGTSGWSAWIENDLRKWDCTVGTVEYGSNKIYLDSKTGYRINVTIPSDASPELCTLVLKHNSGKTWKAPMSVSIVPELDTSFYTMNVTDTHFFRYGGSSVSGQNDGKSIGLMAKVGTLAGVRFFSHTGDIHLGGSHSRADAIRDFMIQPIVQMGRVPFILAEGNHEYDIYVSPVPSLTEGDRTGDYDASVGDRYFGMRSQIMGMGSFAVVKHFFGAYYGDIPLRDNITAKWNSVFGSGSPYTYRLLLQHTHDSITALFYNGNNPPPIAPNPHLILKGHNHAWRCDKSSPYYVLSLGGGDSSSYGACTFLNFNLNGSTWSCPQATTSFGPANKYNTIIDCRDGYDITALRDSYSNPNDGTASNNTCTIINDINFNFYDGRVRFLMEQGSYTVSGGTILKTYDYEEVDGSWHTAVLVKVNIPASSSTTVTINKIGGSDDYLLDYSFNNDTIGAAPAGWTINSSGGPVTVEAVPSSSDKSMKLYKAAAESGYSAGYKTFTAQTSGIVRYDTWVMTPETTSDKYIMARNFEENKIAATIAFSNGYIKAGSTNVQQFTAGQWYHIVIDLDISSKTFSLYIDGVNRGVYNFQDSSVTNIGEVLFTISPGCKGTFYISDIKIKKIGAIIKSWEFNSAGDTEGWTGNWHVGNLVANGSYLNGNITGIDPALTSSDNLGCDISNNKYIRIRMKNNTSSSWGQIYFITTTDTVWNEDKHVNFSIIPNDPGYTEYIIDMSQLPSKWTGTLKQLRIDPSIGVSSGSFSIDYVRIGNQ